MHIQKKHKNIDDNININEHSLTSLDEFILWLAKAQIIGVFFFATFGVWTIIKGYSDNILRDSLISLAGFTLVFLFVQEKYIKIKQLTLAKILFAISIVGGSFMSINSILTFGTMFSKQPITFEIKDLYGFIAYCISIAIIIYYYKRLVWENKIRTTDINLKFSDNIQKMLPEQTIMTTITNSKDNTIQLIIMTENERTEMEKEIQELINQANEKRSRK
ncbi:MAG: hypothetical protein IKX14_03070 [Neisseriaceae bacterium]|nr:hypothetical protein [Neisseriaceae bacterium]